MHDSQVDSGRSCRFRLQLPLPEHERGFALRRGTLSVCAVRDFIILVAPVGIYTSGKGSSAAGVTVSVVKDSKGEFCSEGGAMVLG